MTADVENLLLEHLKALRNELREFRNEFHIETDNLKMRMSALEAAMIGVKREITFGDEAERATRSRSIRSSSASARIEKRLDVA